MNYKSILAALRKYHEINNALPDRIIVYRDGVGDGQVCYVSFLCMMYIGKLNAYLFERMRALQKL